jgi:hypothetical protein
MQLMLILCGVALYFGGCECSDFFLTRQPGAESFRPKLWVRFVYWSVIAILIGGLGVLLVFVVLRLRTVFVDSEGISSCDLLGTRRRSIPWSEVSRISSDWQEEYMSRARLPAITGYSVTVTGRTGNKIEHSVLNTGQARFLDALRRYVPREVFDPGLYDWHP